MKAGGRRRQRAGLIGGGVALVVVLALALTGTLRGLEHSTIDARFELRGAQTTSDVAVVAIDERTFSSIGATWPIRRRFHARMVDRLRAAGVRRVVYDVQFTEPSDRPADDLELLEAVERTPGTILATGESDAEGRTRVLGGDAQLASVGARAAGSTFPSDAGGVIRRYSRDNAKLDSLATAAAGELGREPGASDFQPDGTALIDFRGPAGTIPTYSFADVLAGRVDPARLRGRIVVVGATAPVLQDIHPTSAAGARMMPGPEIQANAIWTALRGNPLKEVPGPGVAAVLVLLGLIGTWLVLWLGPLRGSAVAVAVGVAYSGAAVFAFTHGVVLPVAAPVLALVATAAVTTIVVVASELAWRAHLSRYSAQLEQEVRARTAELAGSQLEVVRRLARAAELRDDDTGEHIDRMSELCGEVAREVGYSDADAELLKHASALHDIGKIGVPDSILLKPGRLTDEEFTVMREHVVAGAELLAGSESPLLQLAELVARTHHEKWDGTGYPAKLSGESIPLAGRIAAVCDVFDALTHERPYKSAWSIAEACAEVARCRGAHFDPRVADALLVVIERQFGPAAMEQQVAA